MRHAHVCAQVTGGSGGYGAGMAAAPGGPQAPRAYPGGGGGGDAQLQPLPSGRAADAPPQYSSRYAPPQQAVGGGAGAGWTTDGY